LDALRHRRVVFDHKYAHDFLGERWRIVKFSDVNLTAGHVKKKLNPPGPTGKPGARRKVRYLPNLKPVDP
ncbi:MAG: hypothetical protein ACE5H8_10460, partial [Alphaproteobacteria bacterium]